MEIYRVKRDITRATSLVHLSIAVPSDIALLSRVFSHSLTVGLDILRSVERSELDGTHYPSGETIELNSQP